MPAARIALLFLLTGVTWGLGFLFIRISVEGLTPLQFVFARTAIAAIAMCLVMVIGKRTWPRGWLAWRRISILSVFGMFLPFVLYAYAGELIPSALSSIYNAAVPISTTLLTLLVLRQERISGRKLLAILLGAIGVLIVLAPWNMASGGFNVRGQVYALLAVLLLGFAFSYTRKAITPRGLDPVGVATGQVIVSSIFGTVFLPFTDLAGMQFSGPIVLSLVLIGVFGTGLAYVWNFQVIEYWGAASASMVTYLTTIVGVLAGFIVMHEVMGLNQLIGAGVVFLSVAIGVTSGTPRRDNLR